MVYIYWSGTDKLKVIMRDLNLSMKDSFHEILSLETG